MRRCTASATVTCGGALHPPQSHAEVHYLRHCHMWRCTASATVTCGGALPPPLSHPAITLIFLRIRSTTSFRRQSLAPPAHFYTWTEPCCEMRGIHRHSDPCRSGVTAAAARNDSSVGVRRLTPPQRTIRNDQSREHHLLALSLHFALASITAAEPSPDHHHVY